MRGANERLPAEGPHLPGDRHSADPQVRQVLRTPPVPAGGARSRAPQGVGLLRTAGEEADQYNVSEKQLRAAFDTAVKADGRTGEILVRLLECRLDSVVHARGGPRQQPDQAAVQLAATGANTDVAPPPYQSVSLSDLRATLEAQPERWQVPIICHVQLVVEFYSR
jgi:ribosomal protein S4